MYSSIRTVPLIGKSAGERILSSALTINLAIPAFRAASFTASAVISPETFIGSPVGRIIRDTCSDVQMAGFSSWLDQTFSSVIILHLLVFYEILIIGWGAGGMLQPHSGIYNRPEVERGKN